MENKALAWLIVLIILFGLVNIGFTMTASSRIKAGVSKSELKTAIDGIVFPAYPKAEAVNFSGIETRLDTLELEVLELGDEDVTEEMEAERLVLEEIDTRDFKRAVFDGLVNFSESIESYRHITDIVVKDIDVDYADEEAEVTVDIKVYYYVDGDDDENERARFEEFVVLVTDLDEDEDFADAEVDEDSYLPLVVNKVY